MKRVHLQPILIDEHGVARFRANALVRYLLDNGGLDMNALAMFAIKTGVSKEDQQQFAQLIGYSVDGYADLSYAEGSASVRAADREVAALLRKKKT